MLYKHLKQRINLNFKIKQDQWPDKLVNYFKSTKKLLSIFLRSSFSGKTEIVAKKWLVHSRTTFYCGCYEILFKAITCLFRGHWGNGTFLQPFFWPFFGTKSPNWIFLKDKEFFGGFFPIRPLIGHMPDFWCIFAIFFWF